MVDHKNSIRDQFTKQAYLFQSSHQSAESAIRQALSTSGVQDDDTVLDVACGPGVLACALAEVARHVTGIDITPAMLKHARLLQKSRGIENVTWRLGDVYRLPFADNSFSIIFSRYALHHLENVGIALREMVRVCMPGGRIVLIDSAPPPDKSEAFNEIERMRDPSHTSAFTKDEIVREMNGCGLAVEKLHLYAWEVSAESLLARSFPDDGDRMRIFSIYENDVGVDRLAMNARDVDGVLHVTFPTLIAVGRKPGG